VCVCVHVRTRACTCVCALVRGCARTCADARAKDCELRDSMMSGSKESIACFKVVCCLLGGSCFVTPVLILTSTKCKYTA